MEHKPARNASENWPIASAGFSSGGIGAMHLLAKRTGLVEAIDRRLHLLKVQLPYHESDHVLNIAYNTLGSPRESTGVRGVRGTHTSIMAKTAQKRSARGARTARISTDVILVKAESFS